MSNDDLTRIESHFRFGDNWASYAELIDDAAVREAEAGLERLVSRDAIRGRAFLDIGCGSGLHALAAARLGAARVRAVDIDPQSVATTRTLLAAHAPDVDWTAEERSVFDLSPDAMGRFDIVYSWGVLHHTGDLDGAMRRAAALVAAGGTFVFALYRQTRLDGFWRAEKRWYAKAGPRAQRRADAIYKALFKLGLRATGRSFESYVAARRFERGMDFDHDVRDWLGGYPYETISPERVAALLTSLGFEPVKCVTRGREWGLFGSGCDEYVYRRA